MPLDKNNTTNRFGEVTNIDFAKNPDRFDREVVPEYTPDVPLTYNENSQIVFTTTNVDTNINASQAKAVIDTGNRLINELTQDHEYTFENGLIAHNGKSVITIKSDKIPPLATAGTRTHMVNQKNSDPTLTVNPENLDEKSSHVLSEIIASTHHKYVMNCDSFEAMKKFIANASHDTIQLLLDPNTIEINYAGSKDLEEHKTEIQNLLQQRLNEHKNSGPRA